MTKAAFVKAGRGLLPCDEDGRELMAALSQGQQVMVNIHTPRNIRHHRLFFVLLHKIVEAGAWSGSREALRKTLLYETNTVDIVIMFDGTIEYTVRSMDFENMPQNEFNIFFDKALEKISNDLLQSDDWELLKAEIYEAVDGRLGVQMREYDERYRA